MFSVRIVNVDHYNAAPIPGLDPSYSDFRGAEVKQVPVVRIFGITPAGQKTCLHLHDAFPYILIPFDGTQPVNRYMFQLATSIDKAINISFGNTNSTTQYVYKITLESCMAVDLLQNGAVMNRCFQPHEAHIPYILQVMIDYNLYGMNFILLKQFKFRRKKIETLDLEDVNNLNPSQNFKSESNKSDLLDADLSLKLWNTNMVSSDLLLSEKTQAMSTCELEIDAVVQDIQNQANLLENNGMNPGIAEIWNDEGQRRKKLGRSSQITPISSQERPPLPIINSELFYKQQIEEKLQNLTANLESDVSALEDSQTYEGSGIEVDLYCPENASRNAKVLADSSLENNDDFEKISETPPEDINKSASAVVNEEIISSLSQSFSASQQLNTSILDSQDAEIIELVAKLDFSQDLPKPEDADSVLSSQPICIDELGSADNEDEETLQMTQQIWDSDIAPENFSDRLDKNLNNYKDEIEEIPQLDGPLDPKNNSSGTSKNDHYQIATPVRMQLAEGTSTEVCLNNSSCLNDQAISYVSMDQLSMPTSANGSLLGAGFSTAPVYNTSQYGMMHDAWGYSNHPLWAGNNSGIIGMTGSSCYSQGFLDISLQPEWMTSSSQSEAKDPYASYQQNVCNSHSPGINSLSINNATANSGYYINSSQYNINQNHLTAEKYDPRSMMETSSSVHDSTKYTPMSKASSISSNASSYNTQNIQCSVSSQNYISLQHISSVAKNYLETWCDSSSEVSKLNNPSTCALMDQTNASNIYTANSAIISGSGKKLPYVNNSQNQKLSEIPLSTDKLLQKDNILTYDIYSKNPVNNNQVINESRLSSISRKDMAYLELGKYDRRESRDKRGSHYIPDGTSNNNINSLPAYNNIRETVSLPAEIPNNTSPKFSESSDTSDSADNSDEDEEAINQNIPSVKSLYEDNQSKDLTLSGVGNKDDSRNTDKLDPSKVILNIQQKNEHKKVCIVDNKVHVSFTPELNEQKNIKQKHSVITQNDRMKSISDKNKSQLNVSNHFSAEATTNQLPAEATNSQLQVEATKSQLPAEATISQLPAEATISQLPAEATISQLPAEATISQLPAEATISQLPAEATISQLPAEATISQLPAETTKSQLSAEATKSQLPAEATKSQLPAEATKSQLPAEATKSQLPAEATKSQLPAETTKNQLSAEATTNQLPAEATKSQLPAEATKSQLPAEATKSQLPAEATKNQLPAETTISQVPGGTINIQVPAGATNSQLSAEATISQIPGRTSSIQVAAGASNTRIPAGAANIRISTKDTISEKQIKICRGLQIKKPKCSIGDKDSNNCELNKKLEKSKNDKLKPVKADEVTQNKNIQKTDTNTNENNVCRVRCSVNMEEIRLQRKSCVVSVESSACDLNSKLKHHKHSPVPVLQKIASLIQKGNPRNDENGLDVSNIPLEDFREPAISKSALHSLSEGMKDHRWKFHPEVNRDLKQKRPETKKSVKFHPSSYKNEDSLCKEKENHKRLLLKLAPTKGESWMISSVQNPSLSKSKNRNSSNHSKRVATSVLNDIRPIQNPKLPKPSVINSDADSKSKNPPTIPKIIFRKDVGINVSPKQLHPRTVGGYYMVKFHGQKVSVPQSVKLVDLLKLGKEKVLVKKLSENTIIEFSHHFSSSKNNAAVIKKKGRQSKILQEQLTSCLQMRENQKSKLWKLHVSENIGLKICLKANSEDKTQENNQGNKTINKDPTCNNTFSKLRKCRYLRTRSNSKNSSAQAISDREKVLDKKCKNIDSVSNEKFTKIKIKSVDDFNCNGSKSPLKISDTLNKPEVSSDNVTRTIPVRSRRSKVDYNPHAFSHLLNFDSLFLNDKSQKRQSRGSLQNKIGEFESLPQINNEFRRQQSNVSRGRGRNVIYKGCRMLKVKLKRLENSDLKLKYPDSVKAVVKENLSKKPKRIKLSLSALKKKISESENMQNEKLSPISNPSKAVSVSSNNAETKNNCMKSESSLHLNSTILESANFGSSKSFTKQRKSNKKAKNSKGNKHNGEISDDKSVSTCKQQHSSSTAASKLPSSANPMDKSSIADTVGISNNQKVLTDSDPSISLELKQDIQNISEQSPKYKDAMWSLSFLSPPDKISCHKIASPPKCWSPNETVEKDLELSNSSFNSDPYNSICENAPNFTNYSTDRRLKNNIDKPYTNNASTNNVFLENDTHVTGRPISFPQVGTSLIDDKGCNEKKLSDTESGHKFSSAINLNKQSYLEQKTFIIRDPHFSDISDDEDPFLENCAAPASKPENHPTKPEKYENNSVNCKEVNFSGSVQDKQQNQEKQPGVELKNTEFNFEDDDDVDENLSEKSLSLYSTKSEIEEEDEDGLGESLILSDLSGEESDKEITKHENTIMKAVCEKAIKVINDKTFCEKMKVDILATETQKSLVTVNEAKLTLNSDLIETRKDVVLNEFKESSEFEDFEKPKTHFNSSETQQMITKNNSQENNLKSNNVKDKATNKLRINKELQTQDSYSTVSLNKIAVKDNINCSSSTDQDLLKKESVSNYLELGTSVQNSEDIFTPCLTLLPPLIPIETGSWDESLHSQDINNTTVHTLSTLKRCFSESDLICEKKFSYWDSNLLTSVGEVIISQSAVLLDFNKIHSTFTESIEMNPLIRRNSAGSDEITFKSDTVKKTDTTPKIEKSATINCKISKSGDSKSNALCFEKNPIHSSQNDSHNFQLTEKNMEEISDVINVIDKIIAEILNSENNTKENIKNQKNELSISNVSKNLLQIYKPVKNKANLNIKEPLNHSSTICNASNNLQKDKDYSMDQGTNSEISQKERKYLNGEETQHSTSSLLNIPVTADTEFHAKKSRAILNATVTLHTNLKSKNVIPNLNTNNKPNKTDKETTTFSESLNCESKNLLEDEDFLNIDEIIPGTPECERFNSLLNHQNNKKCGLKRVMDVKQLSLNKTKNLQKSQDDNRSSSSKLLDSDCINDPEKDNVIENTSKILSNFVSTESSSSITSKQDTMFQLDNHVKPSISMNVSVDSEDIPCGQRSPSESCIGEVLHNICCSVESESKIETSDGSQSKDEEFPTTITCSNSCIKVIDPTEIQLVDINYDNIINTYGEIKSNQEALAKSKSHEMKQVSDLEVANDNIPSNNLVNSENKTLNKVKQFDNISDESTQFSDDKSSQEEITTESKTGLDCKINRKLLDSSTSNVNECGIPEALFKIVDLINMQPINENLEVKTIPSNISGGSTDLLSVNDNAKSIHKAIEDNIETLDHVDDHRKVNINKKMKLSTYDELASPLPSQSIQSFYDVSDTYTELTAVEHNNSIDSKNLPDDILAKIETKQEKKIRKIWKFQNLPPTQQEVIQRCSVYGIPEFHHQDLFYGNEKDAQEKARIGKKSGQSWQKNTLTEFEGKYQESGLASWKTILQSTALQSNINNSKENKEKRCVLVPVKLPPSSDSVRMWIKEKSVHEVPFSDEKCEKRMPITDNRTSADCNIIRVEDAEKNNIPSKMQLDRSFGNSGNQNNINIVYIEKLYSNEGSLQREILKKVFSPVETVPKASRWDCNSTSVSPHHSTPSSRRAALKSLPCTPIKRAASPCDEKREPKRRKLQLNKINEESESENSNCLTASKQCQKKVNVCSFEEEEQKAKKQKLIEVNDLSDTSVSADRSPLHKNLQFKDVKSLSSEKALLKIPDYSPHSSVFNSGIDGPTPNNSCAFKMSLQNLQDAKSTLQYQHLTVMSMELHIRTREDLRPDPEFDPICVIFYHITCDRSSQDDRKNIFTGSIIVIPKTEPNLSMNNGNSSAEYKCTCINNKVSNSELVTKESKESCCNLQKISTIGNSDTTDMSEFSHQSCEFCRTSKFKKQLFIKSGITDIKVTYVENETALFEEFGKLMRRWDPDILVGFEIQMLSWGYLIQRALALKININALISRIPDSSTTKSFSSEAFEYMAEHNSEISVVGRIVLNLWRLMRHEVNLTGYTFENVVYHILHQRIPLYSFQSLTQWFDDKLDLLRWRTIKHYIVRVKGNIDLINQLDIIGRTSELARLFGIQFYEVLSRGSQFRVESMMLRTAKPLKYTAVSPSVQQRARMRAPECLPLVMEPESKMYTNPVVVLDFQSLYPSIIIAYNYCFSTCLGRVDLIGRNEPFEFGCTSLKVPPSLLMKLQDELFVSPVGVAFVKPSIRKGVLPRMLEEILETRLMVKKAMKEHKGNKAIHRILDARQLGLKLIANVTYGYTSANFSGRMPSVEVADSIVAKGRETLERAIRLVQETAKWKASVVYGDTDSLFVHLPGRSKEDAFRIGQEIAETITAMNPKPVKLKFEKVYLPCILQTKKRYVGFMYETVDQKEPVFDAKGIETVRRDGCPAVAKILEKSIKLLFLNKDVSQVKEYVQRQFQKLLIGRVSLQDLTFAREYRGMAGYKPGACVPALEISKRLLRRDRRAEPRVGERVSHVVVYGSPGQPLFQLVRQPQEVLLDPNLHINAQYYIKNAIIPPLQRVFNLIGVDVQTWYSELPRLARCISHLRPLEDYPNKRGTISQYFAQKNCNACGEETTQGLCNSCVENPQATVVTLNYRISHWEAIHRNLCQICQSCMGSRDSELSCISLDCPVFHRLSRTSQESIQSSHLRNLCNKFFSL